MRLEKIGLGETGSFSPIFLDYISGAEALRPFYEASPQIEAFKSQIAKKQFPANKREVLHQVLSEQYSDLPKQAPVDNNLRLLREENTFTVTTGHQLNLFTGPLYFIYKIVTAINTCKALAKAYPEYNFVPVYWMASEDHDFDEIAFFNLFGKRHTWETSQKGAVGRFHLEGISSILNELDSLPDFFKAAYTQHTNLADAVRSYVNAIFGHEGLVVVDADHRALKSLFSPVMATDLFEDTHKNSVDTTSEKLSSAGYKPQVNARDINLFYLDDGVRERIVEENGTFKVLNTTLTFDGAELKHLLKETPEKLSPNVILRPVYQETILPNLAYIGGGAEIAYWLQFKGIFDAHQVAFPILMPRNFALVVNQSTQRKLSKTGLEVAALFVDKDTLVKNFIKENSSHTLQLDDEKAKIQAIFDQIGILGKSIEPTLEKSIQATAQKAVNSIGDIEKRLVKAEKRNQETRLKQIEGVLEALFPNGTLQERHDNFLNFYQNNAGFVHDLLALLSPFDYQLHVLFDTPQKTT